MARAAKASGSGFGAVVDDPGAPLVEVLGAVLGDVVGEVLVGVLVDVVVGGAVVEVVDEVVVDVSWATAARAETRNALTSTPATTARARSMPSYRRKCPAR
ncbi:MAG TPA: hypothetical protein VK549_07175 [Acidimicrobiia bacterium]|nr:hypothetical protein [Acidimicrobiia bacterium]